MLKVALKRDKVEWGMKMRTWMTALFISALIVMGGAYTLQRSSVSRNIDSCKDGPDNFAASCYTALINKTLQERGLPQALQLTGLISDSDPAFAAYCHSNMHDLGHAAYTVFSKTKDIDISPEVSYCQFGFFHGFMEDMMRNTGSVSDAKAFCDAVGKKLNTQNSLSNCYHGIGHGSTDGSDPRIWGNALAMVGPGLSLCRQISPNDELLRSCDMGAFNSIELMYPDPKYKLPITGNPFALCEKSSFTPIEKKACYTEMSVRANDISEGDFRKALLFVRSTDPAYRARTTQYVALYAIGRGRADISALLTTCRRVAPLYIENCIAGIAMGLKVYGKPGKEYDNTVAFCKDVALSAHERDVCVETAIQTDAYSNTERQKICEKFPPEMRVASCKKT